MRLDIGDPPYAPPVDPAPQRAPSDPPVAPPNPKKILMIVLGSIVAAAALGGAITGLILWLTADMREVTHRFLGHVRAGRDDLAYPMLSEGLRARVSPATFDSYVSRRAPRLRESRGEWINGFGGNLSRECGEVWLEHGEAGDSTLYVLLEKEGGVWRVGALTENEDEFGECQDD